MTFGEKLKKLRGDNGMTQEELAEQIFVTRTAISKWETDKGYPSIDSLKEQSKLFGVSIDELISDSDVENKKLLDEKHTRKMYLIAIGCFGNRTIYTIDGVFTNIVFGNFQFALRDAIHGICVSVKTQR